MDCGRREYIRTEADEEGKERKKNILCGGGGESLIWEGQASRRQQRPSQLPVFSLYYLTINISISKGLWCVGHQEQKSVSLNDLDCFDRHKSRSTDFKYKFVK